MAARILIGMGFAALFVFKPALAEDQTAPPPGRYQILFSPIARADTYLLDTTTGQVWRQVAAPEVIGHPVVWEPMERIQPERGPITYPEFLKKYGANADPNASLAFPNTQGQLLTPGVR